MNNFQDKYKRKPGGLNDPLTGRMVRAGQHEERRKVNRAAHYSRYRDVSASPIKQVSKSTKLDPETRLRKWKMEKEMRKKMEQQKKKPVFKVGVVHHHFYSPTINDRRNDKSAPCHCRVYKAKPQPSPPKRVTRATQKRLEAKKAATQAVPAATPAPKVGNLRSQKKLFSTVKRAAGPSFAPQNYAFKGPVGIKEIPMFGRFAITRDSLVKNDLSVELKACADMPWPTALHAAEAAQSPCRTRDRLVRQNAAERLSLPASCEDAVDVEDSAQSENSKTVGESENKAQTNRTIEIDKNVTVDKNPQCPTSPSPAMFSPYVTTSRGKDQARRERRSKMGIGRTPPEDVPTKETVMQSLNISVEEEERTAQYFKFILQREIDRLNELCAKWEGVKSEPEITEDARYLINQAIGQTTLLLRKKFERFRSLVADCETGRGEMLVQCRDLQGFWDMTYVEVKDCDSRFQKLEELRSKNWIEKEEEEIVVTTRRPAGTRKKVAANKFAATAKSSARSWILAKRKKMLDTAATSEEVITVRHDSVMSTPAKKGSTSSTPRDKTRRSAINTPRTVPKATRRSSLKPTPQGSPFLRLRKVQLSEKKNVRSPLTVMKISKMCKTPEIRLDDTISYVNSDQTPGKGILKKSDDTSSTDISVSKCTRKVDFHENVETKEKEIKEHLENSIDLGRALAQIESYNSDGSDDVFETEDQPSDNVTMRRVEKRLDFENESITETENTDTAESSAVVAAVPEKFAFPTIAVTAASPQKPHSISQSVSSMSEKAKKRSSRYDELPNRENHSDEEFSTRVLRNRSVIMSTPKKNNRRSKKSASTEETFIDLDSSTKENTDPHMRERKSSVLESRKIAEIEYDVNKRDKLRRSTRKSVRFNAEDCTACADSAKPVHPMTPHSRRSRKISLLGETSVQSAVPLFNGDLMTFDSPILPVPPRVRRPSEANRKTSGP